MTRRWSLRTRFVAAASLCLLPLIGVSLFLLQSTLNHSRDQLADTQFAISDVVSQGLSATIEENQNVLTDYARDDRIRGMQAVESQGALNEIRAARPSLNGVFLLAPNGSVVSSVGGIDPAILLPQLQDVSSKALTAGEQAISNSITLADPNVDVIALMAPVLADPEQANQGSPVGAIGSFLTVDRLQQNFQPASGLTSGETTIAIVVDGQGVIADSTGGNELDTVLTSDVWAGPVAEAFAGKRSQAVYHDANGEERVAIAAPVGLAGVNWATIVTNPSPMTYGPNKHLLERGLIALGVAVMLTLSLSVIFGELTAKPLRQLTTQAGMITRGDLSQPLQPVGRGEVAALSDAFRDMADRLTSQVRDTEAAREELASQAERLRDLLRRTVRLQEDERRRIASDIHDAVSPLITGALYQTRALKLSNQGSEGDVAESESRENAEANGRDESLATVGDLLERAMSELHDVIFALRPPDLDDLGVVAAIERYVQQINRTGLPSHLEVIGEPQRLSPEARLGVYRIVQEALHNALRHAHADEALVKLEWFEDKVRVTIRDNGSGFDPDQASQPTSLGLLSMRERAAAIGATLEIASRPGSGTAIVLERNFAGDLVMENGSDILVDEALDESEPEDAGDLRRPVPFREVRSA